MNLFEQSALYLQFVAGGQEPQLKPLFMLLVDCKIVYPPSRAEYPSLRRSCSTFESFVSEPNSRAQQRSRAEHVWRKSRSSKPRNQPFSVEVKYMQILNTVSFENVGKSPYIEPYIQR